MQQVPERRRGTRYLVQLSVSYRPPAGNLRGPIEPEPFLEALLELALLHMEQRERRAPAGRGS
ncbi:MAG: hypothetical protein O7B23_01040 [Deltaproteobacteria bacterium]|nr:hypothetical protein [Myxococcales bacterium]MCZ6568730.1 hypothetical protein [Deltaproteobacteria bacterium]MCZ6714089.1 hypothetical protein [Deltaproteobacteria bacterium]TDI96431.1 MAG: hypothetical protein E2O73_13020 [Deltaproteobacteria bacterium]